MTKRWKSRCQISAHLLTIQEDWTLWSQSQLTKIKLAVDLREWWVTFKIYLSNIITSRKWVLSLMTFKINLASMSHKLIMKSMLRGLRRSSNQMNSKILTCGKNHHLWYKRKKVQIGALSPETSKVNPQLFREEIHSVLMDKYQAPKLREKMMVAGTMISLGCHLRKKRKKQRRMLSTFILMESVQTPT